MVVMVLSLIAVSANFWNFPVYILDEAKNAACAMEMLQRGDWVVPTFNGQLRTDKPPLHYYFMMTAYAIGGVTPFAARFFSVIMGLLTVASVYFFARRMEGARFAFLSGLTLTSSLFFVIEFHLAVPDPYFIFFLTLCWLSFAYAFHASKPGYFYLSYAALALAFLAKGPVAVVLSVPILLTYVLTRERASWRVIRQTRWWIGVVIFLAIAAPWWIAIWKEKGVEWVGAFLWGHNVGRFMSPYEGHGSVPGMAVVVLLVSMLPLSALLPGAIFRGWQSRQEHPLVWMACIAVIAVTLFFSLSRTFLPNYVGPAIPFAALLIAFGSERWIGQGKTSRFHRWVSVAIAVLMTASVPAMFEVIRQDKWIGDMPDLAWLFSPWPIGAIAASWFVFQNNVRAALLSWLVSFWATGVLLFYLGVPRIMNHNPVVQSLSIVQQHDRELIGYRFFNPAYIFTLQKTLVTFWTPADILGYTAGRRVMVVSRADYEEELVSAGFRVIFRHPYLFEGSTALVLVNEP